MSDHDRGALELAKNVGKVGGEVVEAESGLAGRVLAACGRGLVLTRPARRERVMALGREVLYPGLPGGVGDPQPMDEDDVGHGVSSDRLDRQLNLTTVSAIRQKSPRS